MLAASTASPNQSLNTAPKPDGWSGVSQGFAAAKQAFRAKDLDEAERILLEILEFAPTEAKAWAWLGHIQRTQGQHELAEKHFQTAKDLLSKQQKSSPTQAASLGLAKLLWQQDEKHEARDMLKILLCQKPDDATLLQLAQAWGVTI